MVGGGCIQCSSGNIWRVAKRHKLFLFFPVLLSSSPSQKVRGVRGSRYCATPQNWVKFGCGRAFSSTYIKFPTHHKTACLGICDRGGFPTCRFGVIELEYLSGRSSVAWKMRVIRLRPRKPRAQTRASSCVRLGTYLCSPPIGYHDAATRGWNFTRVAAGPLGFCKYYDGPTRGGRHRSEMLIPSSHLSCRASLVPGMTGLVCTYPTFRSGRLTVGRYPGIGLHCRSHDCYSVLQRKRRNGNHSTCFSWICIIAFVASYE
jgi:hypothetical protein